MQSSPGCAPDAATYASLLKILSVTQHPQQARVAHGGHRHRHYGHPYWHGILSCCTLNHLCVCCTLAPQLLQVVALHDVMLGSGHTPDADSAALVLAAALQQGGGSGQIRKALALVQFLQARCACRPALLPPMACSCCFEQASSPKHWLLWMLP